MNSTTTNADVLIKHVAHSKDLRYTSPKCAITPSLILVSTIDVDAPHLFSFGEGQAASLVQTRLQIFSTNLFMWILETPKIYRPNAMGGAPLVAVVHEVIGTDHGVITLFPAAVTSMES